MHSPRALLELLRVLPQPPHSRPEDQGDRGPSRVAIEQQLQQSVSAQMGGLPHEFSEIGIQCKVSRQRSASQCATDVAFCMRANKEQWCFLRCGTGQGRSRSPAANASRLRWRSSAASVMVVVTIVLLQGLLRARRSVAWVYPRGYRHVGLPAGSMPDEFPEPSMRVPSCSATSTGK